MPLSFAQVAQSAPYSSRCPSLTVTTNHTRQAAIRSRQVKNTSLAVYQGEKLGARLEGAPKAAQRIRALRPPVYTSRLDKSHNLWDSPAVSVVHQPAGGRDMSDEACTVELHPLGFIVSYEERPMPRMMPGQVMVFAARHAANNYAAACDSNDYELCHKIIAEHGRVYAYATAS